MSRKGQARAAAVLALLTLAGATAASTGAATVRTAGGPEFSPNEYLRDTSRFAPGAITVRPNERVVWIDRDRTPDPHTITFVNRNELPRTAAQVFGCRACELANAHLEDPNDPNSDIARVRVERGGPGLNARGDSLVLAPGARIGGQVTAPVGRTLYYLCVIHPWMQGSIRVSRSAAGVSGGTGGAGLTGRPHH
jgi:plastocyanin